MSRFRTIYASIVATAFLYAVAIFLLAPGAHCNPGVSFGITPSRVILLILTGSILGWLSWEAWKNKWSGPFLFGFFLTLAGGLSNFFERLLFGCVRDFLPLPWGILNNPADWLIFFGTVTLIASSLKKR